MCGGTTAGAARRGSPTGLSPRVRGNHVPVRRPVQIDRSIPACAGEPVKIWFTPSIAWVYPRVCGGTCVSHWRFLASAGLSPRVRGNHRQSGRQRKRTRSIPACAGEPYDGQSYPVYLPVYPRVCGGTVRGPAIAAVVTGLSPRVRGNPTLTGELGQQARSIPACAGEPAACSAFCSRRRVYPRVCGGTR